MYLEFLKKIIAIDIASKTDMPNPTSTKRWLRKIHIVKKKMTNL